MKMKETSLFDSLFEEPKKPSGPVNCLGMTFENDEARRAHFSEELRKKLQDPEFCKIEGFPIGSDEDILNLSDPPYYTACPNPWIADFIAEWEADKKRTEGKGLRTEEMPNNLSPDSTQSSALSPQSYHREPFASDVSEGKNDPIYNAHSYHTKVPHKAIMRYILHYTEPGDIVFDGFCGTGMTGVAAQMCGDREMVMSLGYQVKPDGTILQEEMDEDGKRVWRPFSKLGSRRAVLNDLSPAATFIAYNYNAPVDVPAFEKEAKRILKEVENECGWMYETKHSDGRIGRINHILWSDVFTCPECAGDVVFWEAAVDKNAGKINDEFPCQSCGALLTKRNMDRSWISKYDQEISQNIRQARQVPVAISYSVNGKRFEKTPDKLDIAILAKSDESDIPYWVPITEIPVGDKTGEPLRIGLSHIHHFYTQSALHEMASLWAHFNKLEFRISRACLLSHTAASPYASKLRRFRADKKGGGPLAGTLYIASLITPPNPVLTVRRNVDFVARGLSSIHPKVGSAIVSAQSNSHYPYIENDSLDYIFIDPPFGSNLNYSELNLLWEAWLKVLTNNEQEAIENKAQGKGAIEYRQIMTVCFREAYRVLKPGRWMTVEFSNTKASVWNSIQTALTEAGFIVANVSALDKKQGSFNAVTNTTSVKQDLVISAYKPNGGFEERFQKEAQTEEGVWDFVRTHLKYLPVTKTLSPQSSVLITIPERDPRILFDQMVAYYVRKGYPVPISSQEFQIGLSQRFIERDGMFFLPDQVAEYDRKKMTSGELKQLSMFVSDEASAIQWLRQLIKDKPQTFSDINPQFMQQLGGWSKNEAQLDLRELLNQNFLCYDGKGPVPEQIHGYLSSNWKELRNLPKDDPTLVAKARDRWYVPDPNKAGDLEKLREKALLKEFEEYKEVKKKLKVFRLEAVRTGFKKAWQERDYAVIVAVADKIPNNVLEEDPKLLMWYDQAVTRMGGE
jgi:DNA modification methylase